jgi:hypothetical protein
MGYYRGVPHVTRRERMAQLEAQMREARRGRVPGRRWLKAVQASKAQEARG